MGDVKRLSARRSIARKGEGMLVNSDTYVVRHLAADVLEKGIAPMVCDIDAKSVEEFGPMIGQTGDEFVYVLEGVLELHTSLHAPVRLAQGDSMFFDRGIGRAYVNGGTGRCQILSICSEPK